MAIFVGREEEIRSLDQSLVAAQSGEGGLVLISGEPGIGKTRLAEELSRRAEGRGFAVAWGRSWEGDGTPAYFSWRQALRRLASSMADLFREACQENPEIAALLEGARGALPSDPTESRFRLFDAVADLLRNVSETRPVLIVLDDLHAADVSTLHLLHFVARNLRHDCALLIAGTLRDTAFQARADALPIVAKIAREATSLPLTRLNRAALETWLGASAPLFASSVDRLLSITEGNPLFVGELLAASKKLGFLEWSTTHGLPVGIREAIREHLAILSEPTQRILQIASVLGRDFETAALSAIGGDVGANVDEAIAAGILATSETGLGFTHVLMRDELYATIAAERRAALHRLAAANADDATVSTAHWLRGGSAVDPSRVFRSVITAVRDAIQRFAFEDAAALGQQALDLIAFADRESCELHIVIAEAWTLAGETDSAQRAALKAAEVARLLGDSVLLSRAALAYAIEVTLEERNLTSITLLRSALDALDRGDSTTRAQVMGRLSTALFPCPPDELESALEMAKVALSMARRLGDEETLFAVLRFTRSTPYEAVDAKTRFVLNAETIVLAKKLGRVPLVAALFSWQVAACIDLGDLDAATREADAMEAALAPYKQPSYRYQLPLVRAMLADIEGRFAEADSLSREALRLSEEHGLTGGLILFATQRMGFLHTRNDDQGWSEHEPMVLRLFDNGAMFALFRSIFDAVCGRVDRVRAAFAVLKTLPLRTLPDGVGLAGACAIAGITEYAQEFYDLLLVEDRKAPWQFGPGRVTSTGPRALILGRLAALLGRDDEALVHFARARTFVVGLRSRPFIAQIDLAAAELNAGRDPETARNQAELARSLAAELGMSGVEARSLAVLEKLNTIKVSDPTLTVALEKTKKGTARSELRLAREGEMWRISSGHLQTVLKDTKGLSYLALLVREPCREIHVLELIGASHDGDAGTMLDEKAKRAYRERAESLRERLDEAQRNADVGRAQRAKEELDALALELKRAVGLGGRDRRAVSPIERARINVQRRIRDVIARVEASDTALGEHLDLSIRTGVFCVYLPTWRPISERDGTTKST